MKRNFPFIASIAIALVCSLNAFGFGRIGHYTVAKIAENHLTPSAKANITKYLNGESIVDYATWMDKVRKTDAYKHTDGWHTARIEKDGKIGKGKLYGGLTGEIAKLENGAYKNLSDSAVAVGIKLITHMVGDMHCPSHSRFEAHSQTMTFKINGQEYPFHKFFDAHAIELNRPGWDVDDFVKYLDVVNAAGIAEVQKGSLKNWINKNAAVMEPLYETLYDGADYNGDKAAELISIFGTLEEHQMQIAGYRLAGVLNSIFGD